MDKKAFIGVLIFLSAAMILSGCVRMPYEDGDLVTMPEDYNESVEDIEQEEPELDAIIEVEEEVIGMENDTSIEGDLEEEMVGEDLQGENLTKFDIEQLDEELPEGVSKKVVIDEKETVDLEVNAMDPDGNTLMYSFSEPLNEDGVWETERGDAGEYRSTITVSDGELETSTDVLIVVKSINKEPVMEEIENIVVKEGESVNLKPSATDGNGDMVTFSYSGFMEDSEKEIGYDTVSCEEGVYDCLGTFVTTITASDGYSEVTQDVGITVVNTNRAPAIEPIDDITVNETEFVEVDTSVADPDGNTVNVSFTEPLNGDGTLQTERGDAGEYKIHVTASDGDLSTTEEFMLTINSINVDPVLAPMSDITVKETETVKLRPGAIDANNDTITFEFTGWMNSSEYETTYDDAGEYTTTITAKDPYGGTDSETINITVENVNRPPVILGIY